jgi:hypothetical protein
MVRKIRSRKLLDRGTEGAKVGASGTGVHELVPLATAPLLAEEWKACEAMEREFYLARDAILAFRDLARPAFSRWVQATFAESLASLADLEQKGGELLCLISAVNTYAQRTGCNKREAYAHVTRTLTGSALLAEARARLQPAGQSQNPLFSGSLPEAVEARMEELLGGSRLLLELEPSNGESADPNRLKQLFRDLARVLHPDLNRKLSPREENLWHEAKAAYQAGRIEALEAVAANLEGRGETIVLKTGSLSQLRALRAELDLRLQEARQLLAELEKNPAWKFPLGKKNERKMAKLEKLLRSEMERATDRASTSCSSSERQIARWKMTGSPAPRSTHKKDPPPQLSLFGGPSVM